MKGTKKKKHGEKTKNKEAEPQEKEGGEGGDKDNENNENPSDENSKDKDKSCPKIVIKSKGYGFVAFKTTDEAAGAVSNMHLKDVGGKGSLYVGFAENREERVERLKNRAANASAGQNPGQFDSDGNPTGNSSRRNANNGPNGRGIHVGAYFIKLATGETLCFVDASWVMFLSLRGVTSAAKV